MMKSPHTELQTVGKSLEQLQPDSTLHSSEHPSFERLFLSSHSSPMIIKSPHIGIQLEGVLRHLYPASI